MRLPISSWGIWKTARFFRRRPKRQVPRLRTRQLAREQLEDRTLLAAVSLDAYGGMQEGYSASIAVYRDDSAGDLTVSFFTSDYSAEPGDYQLYDGNFQPVTSSLTFYDGQSSTSLWIYAPTDADGDDESFAIQLSDTGQYMVDSYNSSAFVEIWDSSGSASGVTPTVWLESDLTISEGNSGDLVFRRDTFEGDLTVNFQSTNVTAEADDYGLMSNSVTFYDGWDSASVSLWTTNDADGDDEVIQIDVADGGGAYFVANGATVTIEDFEPPVATDNVYATLEDNALAGNVLTDNTGAGVDFDPNGGPVTLNTFATWGPYYGSLTLAADGAFTYQPTADFNGTDSFGYTIFDEDGQSGSATVTIEVDPDNDPPAASGGYTIYVDEDSSTSSMVSAWDIDGDSLTYGVAPGGDPAHGTLDVNEWGGFSYTPFENYHGSDSFTFQVADPAGPPVTAEIMITVDPVNDAPTAGDDIATTDENQSIALSDLLANDADLDGDSLMVASFDSSTSMGGGVSDNGNGTLFYTPPVGFVGTDTFTYTATDGHGGYASATVTVTVLQQPEVWMDAPASLMENGIGEFTLHRNRSEGELTVTLTGYDNTSEPGDYALPGSVTFAQGVTSMQVLFQAHDDADPDDELFYPAISEAGSYAIGGMSCALVTILDDDPQSVWFESSSATIVEPSSSGFSSSVALMLTRNTSEGELTVLYHVVGSAEAGDYTISPADSVTFYDGQSSTSFWITPEDDDDGDDEQLGIQFEDDPAYMASNSASITIEDREPPVTANKEYFSQMGMAISGNLLTDDTGNGADSDPNGDQLTVLPQPTWGPSNGTLTISSNGDFALTPDPTFVGTVSFGYMVLDEDGETAEGMVAISLYPTEYGDLDAREVKDDVNSDVFNQIESPSTTDLAEDKEDSEGAYVPYNNDDDDYNGTPDKDEPVTSDENDLLPIVVKKSAEDIGGEYQLSFDEDWLRVWDREADGSGGWTYNKVEPGDAISFESGESEKVLFVDAIKIGIVPQNKRDTTITLKWKDAGGQIQEVDSIKVNVFNFIGAVNVPGLVEYEYQAQGGFASDSGWETPRHHEDFENVENSTPHKANIRWGNRAENESAVLGKARYKAHPSYIWALDVNIVSINYATMTLDTPGNAVQADLDEEFMRRHFVCSGDNPPAMTAEINVSEIEGPERGGTMRGVRHIQSGLIQNLTVTAYSATIGGQAVNNSLQRGEPYLDMITGSWTGTVDPDHGKWCGNKTEPWSATAASKKPWYDFKNKTNGNGVGEFQAEADELQTNVQFAIADTPATNAVPTDASAPNASANSLVWDFEIFFAARTTDDGLTQSFGGVPKQDVQEVYGPLVFGAWKFDGSGTWADADWTRTAGDGVVPVTEFTTEDAYNKEMKTDGDAFNTQLGDSTWAAN